MGSNALALADGALGAPHRRRVLEAAAALSEARRRKDLAPLGAKASRTRQSLLRCAAELFLRDGYRTTSVERIHSDAGLSLGAFYQYFSDKADLMAALVGEAILASADRVFPDIEALDPDGPGPRLAVERFVVHYAESAAFQRVWEEATHVEPLIADFRRVVTAAIVGELADHIRAGQAAGTVSEALAPVPTATALTACVDRYCYLTFVDARRTGPKVVAETIDVLTQVWRRVLAEPAAPR